MAPALGWAPLYTLVRQGGGFATSVHFTPTAVDSVEQTYAITLELLSPEGRPIWTERREFTTRTRPERFYLEQALQELGQPALTGLLCIHPQCLSRPADPQRGVFLECWVDITDTVGSYTSFPAVPYRGESKQILAPEERIVPGIVVTASQTTRLLVLNPTKRPLEAEITLYNHQGSTLRADCSVPPWGWWHEAIDSLLPGAQAHLAGQVGSVRLQSTLKTLLFFDFFHRATGVSMGMDHAAPFFSRRHH